MIDLRLADALGRDGLVALADNSVDAIITDPPFGLQAHSKCVESRSPDGHRHVDQPLPFPPLGQEQMHAIAALAGRKLKSCGSFVCFCGYDQLADWPAALRAGGLRLHTIGLVVRINARPMFVGDRPTHVVDPLVIAYRADGKMRWRRGGDQPIWYSRPARWDTGGKNMHPCQKPLELLRQLIEDFTQPGALVVDPFAGSGSTLIAAHQTGRDAIGFEIDRSYYEIARKRLTGSGIALEAAEPAAPAAMAPASNTDVLTVPAPAHARKAPMRRRKAPSEAPSPAVLPGRACAHCRHPLPAGIRSHARFCKKSCRNAASLRRRRGG